MTTFLVPAASRETAVAACDYLDGRLEDADEVYVLTVEERDERDQQAGEGDRAGAGSTGEDGTTGDDGSTASTPFDLARSRLGGLATVRTIRRTGDPARVIVSFARDRDVDEIVIGPPAGGADGGSPSLGRTSRAVLRNTDVPVFVLGQ